MYGITISKPTVRLLQDTGIGTSEIAARTCYDSFDSSENACVTVVNDYPTNGMVAEDNLKEINAIGHSDLLDKLAWTHFHHSILEHAVLTYMVTGTSRGVLQEHARHRIQAISVRSTRYTMTPVINAFLVELLRNPSNTIPSDQFYEAILAEDIFVTENVTYNVHQAQDIWWKLKHQYILLGEEEFLKLATTAKGIEAFKEYSDSPGELAAVLTELPNKRNVGDAFKHIVNDNWKVNMIISFNLRSLKNYFGLRDSGAAYFQIRELAKAMKEVTPDKYLNLIVKN